MNATTERFEDFTGTLEPGSYAHDLAHNALSCLKNNYAGKCHKTAQQFARVMVELTNLVRDLEDADMNFSTELNKANKVMHLFSA